MVFCTSTKDGTNNVPFGFAFKFHSTTQSEGAPPHGAPLIESFFLCYYNLFKFGQSLNVCLSIVSVIDGKYTSFKFGKFTIEYSPVPLCSSFKGNCKYMTLPDKTDSSSNSGKIFICCIYKHYATPSHIACGFSVRPPYQAGLCHSSKASVQP